MLKTANFVLTAYSKMREEKDKSRDEIQSKREQGFEIWGNFQPIQIVKDTKIRIFSVLWRES